jgi:hypothetical protein
VPQIGTSNQEALNAAHSSLLFAGIIQDAIMVSKMTYVVRMRYRYYASRTQGLTTQGPPAARPPRLDVERIVIEHIRAVTNDRVADAWPSLGCNQRCGRRIGKGDCSWRMPVVDGTASAVS